MRACGRGVFGKADRLKSTLPGPHTVVVVCVSPVPPLVNHALTRDLLLADYGLSKAQLVILTGGSAGGLSTFLHVDHVASRLSFARVVGLPVCGFFLDHGAQRSKAQRCLAQPSVAQRSAA